MMATKNAGDSPVATEKQNARLEHTRSGATTRDDTTDLGVTMLPGSPDEPVGPEDALGLGPKRGDYRDRLGGVQSYQAVPIPDATPGDEPTVRMEAQNPRAAEIGDEKGKKGGVDT